MSAATLSGADAVKAPSSSSSTSAAAKQPTRGPSSAKAMDGARKQNASPVDGQNRKQQPPPRAWPGINPITRPSSSTPNGTDKAATKPQAPIQQKSTGESNADKHAHDRALYLLASFTGHDATVTLKNGEQFTGIFSGGVFEASKQQYLLKMVRRTRLPSHQQVNGHTDLSHEYIGEGEDHAMMFDKEDTVELYVPDVAPSSAQPAQNGSITSSFRTDTEISARDSSKMPRERELQRWDPGNDSSIGMALEDSGETGWDQFAANERMYGVSSDYDENIYTTQINRNDPRYAQRAAEAARIAREIEGSAPANAHVAEERRKDAARGDGRDEEEKYSGVQRDPTASSTPGPNAYVPPSRRPITSAPTVPGAPHDPAIVSMAKPTPTPHVEPNIAATASPTEPTVAAPSLAKDTAVEAGPSRDLATAPRTPQVAQTENNATVTAPSTQPQLKKPSDSRAEDHVRNVTDHFKQFANIEKLRIRTAQEAKRSNARTEKNIKLNDLKKFAQHFTLPTRVPDDLVPILAKDANKQAEIKRKAEEQAQKAEKEMEERERRKSSADASSPALSTTASQAAPAASHSTQSAAARQRMPQNLRGAPLSGPLQQSPRQIPGPGQNRTFGRPGYPPPPQPLPADLRIPTGPAAPAAQPGPLSPSTRFNPDAQAFVFRPGANAFTPTSDASASRERSAAKSETLESTDFFKDSKQPDPKKRKTIGNDFNPIKHMLEADLTEDQKKNYAANGGIAQPYRTPPTWPEDSTADQPLFKNLIPRPASELPQMHPPSGSSGQVPHLHQLPPHMQGPPLPTPSGRPPFMPPTHHSHPGPYPNPMSHFGPNGSVQNSPRFAHQQIAFNGQIQGMPMPQFPQGQMPGYGVSPSMGYRQMNMPPQGSMMVMPGHQPGQMPIPQGYPRGGGPQGYPPHMMPGIPNGGPPNGQFMNGPGAQSYSPMPPHATPHLPPGHPYAGSPRPSHMMQHTQSHQGFQHGPPMHMQGPPPPGPYAHPPHPQFMQARKMSQGGGQGYPQMTPRQGQSLPVGMGGQPSPGQQPQPGFGFHGDEGK